MIRRARLRRWSLRVAVAASLLWSVPALADVAQSPDDLCAPSDDPCVISTVVDVEALYPLDFGLRTVKVTSTGRFRGTLDLLCGAFESEAAGNWMKLGPATAPEVATITARRGCSLDPTLPCLSDTVCANAGAGICSEGHGGIHLTGEIRGDASSVTLRAAGDIAIEGRILLPGGPPKTEGDGGNLTIESTQGSIESAAYIDVSGGKDESYGIPGFSGNATLRAAVDVTLRAKIVATGGGADIEVDAGRDIAVVASILTQGVGGSPASGGTIDLAAGQDRPELNITGGHRAVPSYQYTVGGDGGYGFFDAGRSIIVGEKVFMRGDSGKQVGPADTSPFSGDWYFEADEDVSFDGILTARFRGNYGHVLHGVSFYTGDEIAIGDRARITTRSHHSADVRFRSYDDGPISIDGRINVSSKETIYYGEVEGYGGDLRVSGGDLTIGGRIVNGGGYQGGYTQFYSCRMRLKKGATIDTGHGTQQNYYRRGANFYIGESMIAEAGSSIIGKPGATHRIVYRDAAKPPLLQGYVKPAPELSVYAALEGCPVCGNSEIDEDETCDDGNTSSGDGCDQMCLLEP